MICRFYIFGWHGDEFLALDPHFVTTAYHCSDPTPIKGTALANNLLLVFVLTSQVAVCHFMLWCTLHCVIGRKTWSVWEKCQWGSRISPGVAPKWMCGPCEHPDQHSIVLQQLDAIRPHSLHSALLEGLIKTTFWESSHSVSVRKEACVAWSRVG